MGAGFSVVGVDIPSAFGVGVALGVVARPTGSRVASSSCILLLTARGWLAVSCCCSRDTDAAVGVVAGHIVHLGRGRSVLVAGVLVGAGFSGAGSACCPQAEIAAARMMASTVAATVCGVLLNMMLLVLSHRISGVCPGVAWTRLFLQRTAGARPWRTFLARGMSLPIRQQAGTFFDNWDFGRSSGRRWRLFVAPTFTTGGQFPCRGGNQAS